MRTKGANGLGRFAVDLEVANFADMELAERGLLRPDKVRRRMIRGIVDSGSASFVLPQAVVKELGLRVAGKVLAKYAAGRRASRSTALGAYVKILDRASTFGAIVEPKRDTALIGAIILEDLDLLVDCRRQRLVPRDPRGALHEIE